jgi:hypothetical protein
MTPIALRVAVVVIGCLFLILNFVTYVKKNLTEKATWMWTLFSVVLILSGLIPGLYDWSYVVDSKGYIIFGIMAAIVISFIFITTKEIANLKKRNRELAIHVSLLNQENERILARLEKMTGLNKSEI